MTIRFSVLVSLSMVGMVGCLNVDSTDFIEQVHWFAELRTGEDMTNPAMSFSGSAEMVAGGGMTDLGIWIHNATGDAAFEWVIRTGRCDDGGQAVASSAHFPTVVIGENDDVRYRQVPRTGSRITIVESNPPASSHYSAEVFSAGPGGGALLTCGEMEAL